MQDKAIDQSTFEGINNSCLVFDGRLVIDANCHTNDPVIYAAGKMTCNEPYFLEKCTVQNFRLDSLTVDISY